MANEETVCRTGKLIIIHTWRPFYYHGITLIPAWISNHMLCKLLGWIIYTFPNFNGETVKVWEWFIHAKNKVK